MIDINKIYDWLKIANRFGDKSKTELAKNLILEEINELFEAVEKNDKNEMLDAYADIQFVLCNLTFFEGLTGKELQNYYLAVVESNNSKFCNSMQEAVDTIYAYAQGEHWDKPDVKIECYMEEKELNGSIIFVVRRKSDDKILKSINYRTASELYNNKYKNK